MRNGNRRGGINSADIEQIGGNGLLHRRALLGKGLVFAGAASIGADATGAAAEPLKDAEWSTHQGKTIGPKGGLSKYEDLTVRVLSNPKGEPRTQHARTPHHLLNGTITPSHLHFTILHNGIPDIDPEQHKMVIHGMVKQPRTYDLDDLLKQVQLEERIYRHRCVETWAMTVPWSGFALSQLLALVEPLASAKYVMFETAQDKTMRGLNAPFYPWPYTEGLAMDEAANDMAFMVTGMYGKPVPPQNGGPLRIALPWKYGFKSAKSIVKITFTDKKPTTFWEGIGPGEYGFWANVNPTVPHPRWSQARERLLGSNEMVPTQIYNGYGDFVAGLYSDRKSEKLFM